MVVIAFPAGSGGSGTTSSGDGSTGGNQSQDTNYHSTGTSYATETPTYGYQQNDGSLGSSSDPLGVTALGDVYNQNTGTIVAGPSTGTGVTVNTTTGGYVEPSSSVSTVPNTGGSTAGTGCTFCDLLNENIGGIPVWGILLVAVAGVAILLALVL